ncbi:DTW domain-containing protein [Spongiibacter sp. KMU-158]|uniref:tRNA-uridine aminocarboxypropyltransferase n=1 Tax=Spongiibacter pelagi TaxID=2760804 RepID=A0A927GXW8_9GAMM|nr:tRNA-uridine aminocarboxypropyltransferase [Spongiibacter pelagi]MBD2859849.1 DTW domain-containing protein [Spongiibacter pelagi]
MSPRLICKDCQRPESTYLCEFIVQRGSGYGLTILQHPKEARHALSSAPLLARSIIGSRLVVGECFEPATLLGSKWQQNSVLLYPGEPSIRVSQIVDAEIKQLVVLDGTWRKTAKLLHLNPWLLNLPRLALQQSQRSRYRIRKSPRADGLSTIEATVQALNVLHSCQDYDAILGAFEQMIDQQIAAMGDILELS